MLSHLTLYRLCNRIWPYIFGVIVSGPISCVLSYLALYRLCYRIWPYIFGVIVSGPIFGVIVSGPRSLVLSHMALDLYSPLVLSSQVV